MGGSRPKNWALRNRACRNTSLVNANFSVNQMCPIICRWKLVKHRYCFGDNRRTKDNRKIKLCGLKACCVTLISCSISANFPALKRWNEKSEVVIAKIKTVPQKASIWEFKIDIFVSSEIQRMNSNLWSKIGTNCRGCKHNVSSKFSSFWKRTFVWKSSVCTK